MSIKIAVNVLDDEEAILIGVKEVLSYSDEFDVECFTKVSDFFNNLNKEVDLIIIDVRLNQGIEIEEILTRISVKNSNAYVIVMSGYMDLKLAEKLSLLGIRWFQKDGDKLFDKLKRIINIIYPSLHRRAKTKHLFK